MNGRAMECAGIHEFILGDRQLHARFSLAIELLARLVVAAQPAMATAALAEAVGKSPNVVSSLLATMHQTGLLCRDQQDENVWFCSSSLNGITLADVFRCIADAPTAGPRKAKRKSAGDGLCSSAQQHVDLLLMQATMAINQVVLQHLQAFDLGRVMAVGSSGALYRFGSAARSCVAEPL